ncbi:site-2 protease family protein [candidate division WWE3 bacterium]|uniref:Site-2 protease family protein n=1 Tax=candidate division WWE3 bacterium TaxID=2053526 RepID=A0A955LJL3_UNCKA|nr:site-2 protease family protein [candidate division WWE3 bacterium]
MSIIIIIATLSFLVFIHELGHFLAAKWAGIQVDEFAIGMGPKLVTFYNDGETNYTLRILPIGGFVNMLGENPPAAGENPIESERSFNSKPPLKRAIVLSAGIFMNILFGTILIGIIFTAIGKPDPKPVLQISEIATNSPAESAGLSSGNYITGYKLPSDDAFSEDFTGSSFSDFVAANQGNEINLQVKLSVDPKMSAYVISLTPRTEVPEGEGAIGISFYESYEINYVKIKLINVPAETIKASVGLVSAIFQGLITMLSNLIHGSVPQDIAGPIGVAKLTSDAAKEGIFPLLQVIALISLNLGIVNLLPFPALDGGRLVFVIFEGITRKKILAKYEGWLHTIGFVLLMILVLVLSYFDIQRFF